MILKYISKRENKISKKLHVNNTIINNQSIHRNEEEGKPKNKFIIFNARDFPFDILDQSKSISEYAPLTIIIKKRQKFIVIIIEAGLYLAFSIQYGHHTQKNLFNAYFSQIIIIIVVAETIKHILRFQKFAFLAFGIYLFRNRNAYFLIWFLCGSTEDI